MKTRAARHAAVWSVFLGVLAVLAGCGQVSGTRSAMGGPGAKAGRAGEVEPPPAPTDPDIARLTPLANPDGILVCEPVSDGADPKAADFGAGASRWLHLAVGGQPAFGRQVAWVGPERVRTELSRADLRLPKDAAARAAKMAGVRIVAVGKVSGKPDALELAYQLYDAPAMTPRGKELRAYPSRC